MSDTKYKPAIAEWVLAFVFIPLGVWCYGFALSKLWLWFLVPFGAVTLTVIQAAGIAYAARYFVNGLRVSESFKTETDFYEQAFVRPVLYPWIVLGYGWLMTRFL